MTLDHFNIFTLSSLYAVVAVYFVTIVMGFIKSAFWIYPYTCHFLDSLCYLSSENALICTNICDANMPSSLSSPAVISISHLPDQLDESCPFRELDAKGSISWKLVLDLPAIYAKSSSRTDCPVLGLSPRTIMNTLETMCSHRHLSHAFSSIPTPSFENSK